jgi:hypothetical protein
MEDQIDKLGLPIDVLGTEFKDIYERFIAGNILGILIKEIHDCQDNCKMEISQAFLYQPVGDIQQSIVDIRVQKIET